MSDRPQAKATNGRTRKKRLILAPEPKDKRPRPENPSLGPSKDGCARRLECLGQLDTLVLALVEPPNISLQELWLGVQAAGDHFSAETAAKVLERLPQLLAAAALKALGLELAAHLEKGAGVEVASLPTEKASEDNLINEAFLVLHNKVEANLDAAMQTLIPMPSLEWLATVAVFYGTLRPSPLPRHILEDCADLAYKLERKHEPKELAHLSRIAKGAALSGTLGRHQIYGLVTDLAAQAIQAGKPPSAEILHDISLALSLLQPWDPEIQNAVSRYREALAQPECSAQSTQVNFMGAASMAGQRNGDAKENQDTFYTSMDGSVACVAVVDGHGRRGAVLSAAARDSIAVAMKRMKIGSSTELAKAVLWVDSELLIHQKAELELSGATCVVMRIDGMGEPKRRLSLVHLGDCGAVLGRMKTHNGGSNGVNSWSTQRLKIDHRPGEDNEAARLIAAGGRVQKMPVPAGHQLDPANMGPPRLWHRQRGQAPGLAMSRGLGDALGKACGLSPQAAMLEMTLTEEDVVLVLGSDGIFDVLSDAEVLHCCRQFIEKRAAAEAAEAVTLSARRQWQQRGPYVDDCTCVVFFL